jgi:hypothetical protein
MVKPQKYKIGVWKTIESKDHKHQIEKPKLNELPTTSQIQNNVNGASPSKNFKCLKSSPRKKFHNKNQQCRFLHIDHQCLCIGSLL